MVNVIRHCEVESTLTMKRLWRSSHNYSGYEFVTLKNVFASSRILFIRSLKQMHFATALTLLSTRGSRHLIRFPRRVSVINYKQKFRHQSFNSLTRSGECYRPYE